MELAAVLGRVRLFDMRWSLVDPGHDIEAYETAHIPGAVFVDLESDLSGEAGPGRHPLPLPEEFTLTMGRLGVGGGDAVVVYDDVAGVIAARMWWMLRSIGHEDVRVLNGGLGRWLAEGRAVESGRNSPRAVEHPPIASFEGVVTVDQLGGRVILDARSPERYRGEIEPVDPKAGHIPGAINMPTTVNLDSRGLVRSGPELAGAYSSFDRPVVSCGSGVTACHGALAMVAAGLDMPDVYIGSFSEWSSLDLPVNIGPEP